VRNLHDREHGELEAVIDGMQVKMYNDGDFFGELALHSRQPRAATVQVTSFTATLLLMPRAGFQLLMTDSGTCFFCDLAYCATIICIRRNVHLTRQV
jgi:hypothetical protein